MKHILLLLFLFSGVTYSQEFSYSGNVNQNGQPIAGASICIKNSKNCVSSDFSGNYTINVKKGDVLVISFIGMKSKEITVDNAVLNSPKVNPTIKTVINTIENEDFMNMLIKSKDTANTTKKSGTFNRNSFRDWGYNNTVSDIKLIKKNAQTVYKVKYSYDYSKLYLELNTGFSFATPLKSSEYQKSYVQGRSLNGELTYQSPETNEIFSWGPLSNTTQNPTNETYLYQNSYNFKTGLNAMIKNPNGDYMKLILNYNQGSILIPTSKNQEVTSSLKVSKKFEDYQNITAQISFNEFRNNFTNANFVVNKILFANGVTPINYDNNQNRLLPNGSQRSFSNLENNPYYLIDFNQDKNKSSILTFDAQYKYENSDDSFISSILSQYSRVQNTNAMLPFSASIVNPELDKRKEYYSLFAFSNAYKHKFRYENFFEVKLNYQFQKRDLNRDFYAGFDPNQFPNNGVLVDKITKSQDRSELLLNANANFKIENIFDYYDELVLKASTDLHYSSTLKNKVLVNYNGSAFLNNLFRKNITIFSRYNFAQIEPGLQNNNLNFNSLQYSLADFKQINNKLEVFTGNENSATTESQTAIGLKNNNYRGWNFAMEVFYKKINDVYAPVFIDNTYAWKPAVDYYQKGIEIDFTKRFGQYYSTNKLQYSANVNFSLYRNKVTSIKTGQQAIPFAGFADISKNYIEGQPLGVIVGSGYLRNQNNLVVIDNDGFPVKDPNQKIIGDPNPDFVIGFDNTFRIKKIVLNLVFDWHQGGQMWNGSQQALNYYGKSQETADLRNTQNYIFEGVMQNGQVNTKAVDFYNPALPVEQNRWVRYGIGGLSEDNIVDASYFRLNSIAVSYQDWTQNRVANYKISLYVTNVFIVSKSKGTFINNTLFNSIETTGLDYFNGPLMTSTGISFNITF